ncbi:MAG: hypothetical protein COB53_03230 [Elusimicrobia bacterium]|nr:MAG: hypothetical protein COB53_03230 [Elusimicrobiota bacterium]
MKPMKTALWAAMSMILALSGTWYVHAQPAKKYEMPKKYRLPKDVDSASLEKELRANGFNVQYFGEDNGRKYFVLSKTETKNPSLFIDAALPEKNKQMRSLLVKLKDGSISDFEKNKLLQILVEKILEL